MTVTRMGQGARIGARTVAARIDGEVPVEMRLADNCLAVFVDDTGHEDLPSGHKVYGLGGCAVMARELDALVRTPWREVRRAVTGSPDLPLHGADLRDPTPEQIEAFTRFFSTQPFARIAVTITTATTLHEDLSSVQTVVKALQLRIVDIAKWTPFESVAIIIEESKRSSPLVAGAFQGFGLSVDDREVPVEVAFMPKAANEPALEVADFIIHTAGGQARQKIGAGHLRKDFQAIFRSMGPKLTSLIDIDTVHRNANEPSGP